MPLTIRTPSFLLLWFAVAVLAVAGGVLLTLLARATP
ncbi:membrane protein implicated in regulation of membrane protease activity [Streptosporangium saharense]|uniref:Membrane protein implicated in regulation of membrane protease activity n=1 Tax=Streptosporangium saharense TaxID=1706840 RepID=A0A7W7VS21_9ACTN|nr:membrane protein implicated in regulation of membrane protease activity [Streptosporangium saharense]